MKCERSFCVKPPVGMPTLLSDTLPYSSSEIRRFSLAAPGYVGDTMVAPFGI